LLLLFGGSGVFLQLLDSFREFPDLCAALADSAVLFFAFSEFGLQSFDLPGLRNLR
jgi:hypothetical protein